MARDPYTVCVHWDLDGSVLERQRQAFPGGEWRLCVWQESVGGHRLTEQPLPLDVTHRFVPVLAAGGRYVAEIGFRSAAGGWRGWAISQPTVSPLEVQYHSHVHLPDENPAPVPREAGRPVDPVSLLAMTPDREKSKIEAAGAAVVREALNRLLWREAREAGGGSSERVTEWVPVESQVTRDRVPNLSVGLTVAPSLPSSSASGSVGISSAASIPAPALPPSRGFWFRVNAEVILYGSTERDAKVTIAGRPIALRDDGSFSFRFLLPDGRFELPVIAVNAAGDDGRAAEVVFSRKTSLQGQVGVHPATPGLMPPGAAALG